MKKNMLIPEKQHPIRGARGGAWDETDEREG